MPINLSIKTLPTMSSSVSGSVLIGITDHCKAS